MMVKPDCELMTVFTTGEVTGVVPDSDGVAVAVLVMVPDALEAIVPETTICIVLFALKLAFTLIALPVPVAPLLMSAVPAVVVAVQLMFVIAAGTASAMSVFKLFEGPVFLTLMV